jgi:hypothetical protein
MSYQDLPKEKRQQLKTFMHHLNELLRNNKLSIQGSFNLNSTEYGFLGIIEDDNTNIYLVDEETYIEYMSSESNE